MKKWSLALSLVCILVACVPAAIPEPTQTSEMPPTSSPTTTPTRIFTPTQTPTPFPTPRFISSRVRPADNMVMVYVPEGTFIMGSTDGYIDEQPVHEVYLSAYWIDQTEVTNAMYALCVNAGACQTPFLLRSQTRSTYYNDSKYTEYPVIYVGWDDAQAYCAWADARLPSEAEWEKAARGTEGFTYPWGNSSPNSDLLNYDMTVRDTSAVGSYPAGASPYGVYDMAGNVTEWVNDWYWSYPGAPSLDRFPGFQGGRVLRGGSFVFDEYFVRSAIRYWGFPDNSGKRPWFTYDVTIGFRCASSKP